MDNKDLQDFKRNIGFGMAFKATLGFYAAQALASIIFLVFLAGGCVTAAYFLGKH